MEDMVNSGVSLVTIWGMRLLTASLILIAGWMIGNYAKKTVISINKLDATLKTFLGGLAKYTIFAVAVISVLGEFGIQTASLLAVLGAAGLAIGLALQGTLSDVAAGVMLLIMRPFNVGDYIEGGGTAGTVKSLGLFGTELATPDNVYIYVPNSNLWGSDMKNFSRNKQRRQDINVGIGYSDDINKAFKTIEAVLKKEKRLITTDGKAPEVMVTNLGESSVDLIIRFWSQGSDYWDLKWDLTKSIKEALDKDGISIPFPMRTIELHDMSTQKPAANDKKKTAAKKKAA